MSDKVSNDLIYEVLKDLQQRIGVLELHNRTVGDRFRSMDDRLAAIDSKLSAIISGISGQITIAESLEDRVAR